jgi:hypothetical protein
MHTPTIILHDGWQTALRVSVLPTNARGVTVCAFVRPCTQQQQQVLSRLSLVVAAC